MREGALALGASKMQVVLHQFPGAQVEYKFKCRNPGVQLAPFANEIRDEIRSLCSLHFQDAELVGTAVAHVDRDLWVVRPRSEMDHPPLVVLRRLEIVPNRGA